MEAQCRIKQQDCCQVEKLASKQHSVDLVEVRGFEPLTSGLQSPRSAKLSYTPKIRLELVAGAGFEPATFGL